jgi:membrane fusion protein, multidrug efflux system
MRRSSTTPASISIAPSASPRAARPAPSSSTRQLRPPINYKATFENADEALWPGQFVNVRVQIEIRRNVVAVPVTAVQYGPEGPYSFVISPDRVAQKRALKVGVVSSTSAIIDDGLAPGDVVVTDGQYRIEAGSVVEVLDAPQSPG